MDKNKIHDGQPEKGSKICVISKAAFRYEGYLESVDIDKFTLSNVCSFGTEDRISYNPVKNYEFYDYVSFRAEYIDSVTVIQCFYPAQETAKSYTRSFPSIVIPETRNNSTGMSPRQLQLSPRSLNYNNVRQFNGVESGYQNTSSYSYNAINRPVFYPNNTFNSFGYVNYKQYNNFKNFNDYGNVNYENNGWRRTPVATNLFPRPVANYTEDYDFEAANKKFEKFKVFNGTEYESEKVKDEKTDNGKTDNENADNEEKSPGEIFGADGLSPVKKTPSYDKKKSFFDNISNKDSLSNINKSLQRAQNTETFGYEFVPNAFWKQKH